MIFLTKINFLKQFKLGEEKNKRVWVDFSCLQLNKTPAKENRGSFVRVFIRIPLKNSFTKKFVFKKKLNQFFLKNIK